MHFASAPRIGDKLWVLIREAQPRVLVLDCSAIPDIEYTALRLLTELEEKLREGGISLWLTALNPEPLRVIERAPLGATLGHERMFFNLEQAVETYHADTDKPGTIH
jgi:MFS superfamily sulfate permease-like transporter